MSTPVIAVVLAHPDDESFPVGGTLGHVAVGHFDWQLMLATSVAVIIGSQLGSRTMASRMKPRQLKQMFGVVLFFVGFKMFWGLF